MKTSIRTLSLCGGILTFCTAAQAQVVIGGWQSGHAEGWVVQNVPPPTYSDPNNGRSITAPAVAGEYSFVAAGVPGFAQSLQITYAGFGAGLQLNLANNPTDLAGFNNNHLLSFTFAVPASTSTAGYSDFYSAILNAPGYGSHAIGDGNNAAATWGANWTAVDLAGSNDNYNYPGSVSQYNGIPTYFYSPDGGGSLLRAQTLTFDYSSILPAILAGGEGYLYLNFSLNNGQGAPDYVFLNNVVLSGGPVPEPASIILLSLGTLAGTLIIRRRR